MEQLHTLFYNLTFLTSLITRRLFQQVNAESRSVIENSFPVCWFTVTKLFFRNIVYTYGDSES